VFLKKKKHNYFKYRSSPKHFFAIELFTKLREILNVSTMDTLHCKNTATLH